MTFDEAMRDYGNDKPSCCHHQGKLLSPRKIMMDTRDRLDEYGKNLDKNGPCRLIVIKTMT